MFELLFILCAILFVNQFMTVLDTDLKVADDVYQSFSGDPHPNVVIETYIDENGHEQRRWITVPRSPQVIWWNIILISLWKRWVIVWGFLAGLFFILG